jgi:hypothetical protein
MHEQHVDTLTRNAGEASSHRRSLLGLGSAVLAGALARPTVASASKTAKRAKKRKKKTCKRQIDQCRDAISAACEGEESCINNFDLCCPLLSDCKAGASLDCLFAHVA